jgi:hypothetical protein
MGVDRKATYVTKLGVRKVKAGFLWNEETLRRVKYAAIEARTSESKWVEDVVLAALNAPQKNEKKNPFDLP